MKSSTCLTAGFSDRLRQEREQLDKTREAGAKLIGVSDVTLWRWESGQSSPSVEQLFQMQSAGFDVIRMLTGESLANHAAIDDDAQWGRCVMAVTAALSHHKLKPSPATCWRLIRLLYTEAVSEAQLKKNVAMAIERASQLETKQE